MKLTLFPVLQWYPRDALSSPISSAIYSCDGALVYAGFCDGAVGIFDADSLRLRCRIAPSAYLSPVSSRYQQYSLSQIQICFSKFQPLNIRADAGNSKVLFLFVQLWKCLSYSDCFTPIRAKSDCPGNERWGCLCGGAIRCGTQMGGTTSPRQCASASHFLHSNFFLCSAFWTPS